MESSNLNNGLKIVDKAKDFEKKKLHSDTALEYKNASNYFKEIDEYRLSAKYLAAYALNMIKFITEKDIELFDERIFDRYILKLNEIENNKNLKKIEKFKILNIAYLELEKIFQDNYMVDMENEIYYKRTELNHKLHWEKFKQKKLEIKKKLRELYLCIISFILHYFCGHGEKRLRAFGWMAFTIIIFAWIYYCFNLIQFTTQRSDPINFFHALYFSVITFTSLGYGDIIPICNGKILASIEVLLGLLMFGMLIASMTRKMQK